MQSGRRRRRGALHAIADRVLVAPRDDRVLEPVAAAVVVGLLEHGAVARVDAPPRVVRYVDLDVVAAELDEPVDDVLVAISSTFEISPARTCSRLRQVALMVKH